MTRSLASEAVAWTCSLRVMLVASWSTRRCVRARVRPRSPVPVEHLVDPGATSMTRSLASKAVAWACSLRVMLVDIRLWPSSRLWCHQHDTQSGIQGGCLDIHSACHAGGKLVDNAGGGLADRGLRTI